MDGQMNDSKRVEPSGPPIEEPTVDSLDHMDTDMDTGNEVGAPEETGTTTDDAEADRYQETLPDLHRKYELLNASRERSASKLALINAKAQSLSEELRAVTEEQEKIRREYHAQHGHLVETDGEIMRAHHLLAARRRKSSLRLLIQPDSIEARLADAGVENGAGVPYSGPSIATTSYINATASTPYVTKKAQYLASPSPNSAAVGTKAPRPSISGIPEPGHIPCPKCGTPIKAIALKDGTMRKHQEKCKGRCTRCQQLGLVCLKNARGRCLPCVDSELDTCSVFTPKSQVARIGNTMVATTGNPSGIYSTFPDNTNAPELVEAAPNGGPSNGNGKFGNSLASPAPNGSDISPFSNGLASPVHTSSGNASFNNSLASPVHSGFGNGPFKNSLASQVYNGPGIGSFSNSIPSPVHNRPGDGSFSNYFTRRIDDEEDTGGAQGSQAIKEGTYLNVELSTKGEDVAMENSEQAEQTLPGVMDNGGEGN